MSFFAGRTTASLGAACGLAAAVLFGASTPAAKWLLESVDPQLLAGLFYFGAGAALSLYRWLAPTTNEAPLRFKDAPTLGGILVAGGLVGPLLLLVGLARTTATTGALLLNLEAPFTMAIAVLIFREHLGRRALAAAALILLGAGVLKVRPGDIGGDALGMICVAASCLAWGIDNNLTQRLALKDPVALVRAKTLGAGALNIAMAFARDVSLPATTSILVALGVGAVSYGLSIVLDAYALRWLGAAREAALFATAPFVGVVLSLLFLRERMAAADIGALALMAAGVVLLLRDKHSHAHRHEPLEHEHLHSHDEHHQHSHAAGTVTTEPHSHFHRHDDLQHEHPHASDLHHRHRH